MSKRWKYVGDVNMLAHGGQFVRQVSKTVWHVIRFDNLESCCGRDAEGHPTYDADLREIDLASLSEQDCASVGRSCDVDEDAPDMWWALACASYGVVHSDIHNEQGNNGHALVRELKALSDNWSER